MCCRYLTTTPPSVCTVKLSSFQYLYEDIIVESVDALFAMTAAIRDSCYQSSPRSHWGKMLQKIFSILLMFSVVRVCLQCYDELSRQQSVGQNNVSNNKVDSSGEDTDDDHDDTGINVEVCWIHGWDIDWSSLYQPDLLWDTEIAYPRSINSVYSGTSRVTLWTMVQPG